MSAGSASLRELGWDDTWDAQWRDHDPAGDAPDGVPARVVRHDGVAVLVAGGEEPRQIHLRASTPALAVGDWVVAGPEAVDGLLDRRSLLRRRDPSTGGEQLIAANLDLMVVVCGLDRPVRAGRIQRLVTQAWDAGAVPVVALTKIDLVDGPDAAGPTDPMGGADELTDARAVVAEAAPGVTIVEASAVDHRGIDTLADLVGGGTVAFLGESGAGKSSLVNALAAAERAAIGVVRSGDSKGRHTTTARELHVLAGVGCVIDTPGMREVGLAAEAEAVDDTFDDVVTLAEGCRFSDCAHDTEPGCAVQAAVAEGSLAEDRLVAWATFRSEAAAADLRADPVARRRADRRFGRLVREAKDMKRR